MPMAAEESLTRGGPPRSVIAFVAAEVAACERAAGIAVRDDFAVYELSGRPVSLRAAVRRLVGRRPTVFGGGRFDLGWCRLVSASRALLVATPACRDAAARRLAAVALDAPDITVADASRRHRVIALAGPRAASLSDSLTAAGGPRPAAVLRDAGRLELVVAAASDAGELHRELLSYGRPYGALSVSAEAVDLLCAAHAVLGCQRGTPSHPLPRSTA
ncbi:MAG: hypothetical protein R2736_11340 [Solirubrobacterales bacterium]